MKGTPRNPPKTETWMYVIDRHKLRRARLRLRLSQADLARAAGMSQQYVSRLEQGTDRDCSERIAVNLCRWLQVDVEDYFRTGESSPMPAVTTPSRGAGRGAA